MTKGDDIQERLIQFAARTIKLTNALPASIAGRHVSNQLIRAATAPAAHHGEARSAECADDFVHKLKSAVKELNESEVWLRIIVVGDMMPQNRVSDLLEECSQLQRITSASIKTARQSAARQRRSSKADR